MAHDPNGWEEDDYFEDLNDEPCEHDNLDIDVMIGTTYCGRCG